MKLFLLRQRNLWGDYGDVLVSGFCSRDVATGRLLLHRGGPFAPPIFFPWGSGMGPALVVTEAFRRSMEGSPLGAVTFRPAVKDRIVALRFAWERWDREADRPRKRPPGGEPANYIWDDPHAPAVAAAMPEFLEALPVVQPAEVLREEGPGGDTQYRLRPGGGDNRGLFRTRETWFDLVVDEPARDWLAGRVGEWVSFEPVIDG